MPRRILFLDKGVVSFQSYEPEALKPGFVRIQARTSLISTGTEGICLHRMFEPGTHWDDWVKYPFKTGYSMVGEVSEVGEGSRFRLGEKVVSRVTHAEDSIAAETNVMAVPEGMSNDDAAWFALATIGFMGAKAGQFRLGDSVAVVGAGPIGQMAIRWAVAAGARHAISIDTVPARLEMALQGGATGTIEATAAEAAGLLADACGGELPRVVVDATGHAPVFEQCLKLPRWLGTLVLLGDSGTPSQQRLTLDVVRRGIQIHGAHIMHETPEWTERNIVELFFDQHQRGRFGLQSLNTHRFRADQCVEAFALTTERRSETMGVLFDWV
ncbi:MAG: zinc-binding dehydrogenase [Fimbriimonas sp.]